VLAGPRARKDVAVASVTTSDSQRADSGLVAGLAAYTLWGFLPLLFDLLHDAGAVTVVANRTIWSLLVVGIVMIAGARTAEVRAILRNPPAVAKMALAALVLALNWLIYVFAVETGQVLEASFGYFINPLVNVAMGVVLLGERLNRWQTLSVTIAVIAIAIQSMGLGGVPIIALSLAISFAYYGYLRKTAKASSLAGLLIETLVLSPVAIGYLAFGLVTTGSVGPLVDPYMMTLLVATGPATALPLLLFAFAVQRLRLTTIGMLQYIAPSIQFVLAITIFGEHLNGVRLLSFGLIWLSLIVYTADSVVRRSRAAA